MELDIGVMIIMVFGFILAWLCERKAEADYRRDTRTRQNYVIRAWRDKA